MATGRLNTLCGPACSPQSEGTPLNDCVVTARRTVLDTLGFGGGSHDSADRQIDGIDDPAPSIEEAVSAFPQCQLL